MRPTGMYGPISVLLVENDSMKGQRIAQQLDTLPLDSVPGVSFTVESCHHLENGLRRLANGGIDVVRLEFASLRCDDVHGVAKNAAEA